MNIKVIREINCTDALNCSNTILNKLKIKFPNIILMAETPTSIINGHLSIKHIQGAHIIQVFIYDTNNVHEGEQGKTDKIRKTPNNRVRKVSVLPLKQDIETEI